MLQSSSRPPRFAPAQQRLFREVLLLLSQREVPYLVSGAFALQQHTGIWRDTKDLDLFLDAADVPPALRLLQEHGLTCEVLDTVWLAKCRADGFYVDLITGMSNGVVTVDRSWIERGHPGVIFGVETRVMAAEELLVSKLFVMRRERFDGSDIAHIIYATRGRLDWTRILALAGEHWGVLLMNLVLFQYIYPAQSGCVPAPVWRELLGRLAEATTHPDPVAPFRGSLIDEFMFAIDVNEWGLENVLEIYRLRREPKIPADAVTCPVGPADVKP